MNKIFSLSLLLMLSVLSFNAKSALVTETFDVEVVSGPGFGEFGSIDITFDDSLISGVGDEFLNGPDVMVEMLLFGQVFTEADDIEYPDFPELGFVDGVIVSLDFIIQEFVDGDLNVTPINDARIGAISGFDIIDSNFGRVYEVDTIEALPVNAPSTLFLLSTALIALSLFQRKR